MKYVFGIFTGPVTQSRKSVVLNTWAKDIPRDQEHFFVYGDCRDRVTVKTGNDLFLDCTETYESICIKTYKFYKHCYDNIDFDYIVKLDDDTYLDVDKFLDQRIAHDYAGHLVSSKIENYIHHYDKCTDRRFEKPVTIQESAKFCCGGGYVISRKAVRIALDNLCESELIRLHKDNIHTDTVNIYGCGAEDRMIGILLENKEITRANAGVWLDQDELLYSVFNGSLFHPVYPDTMRLIKTPKIAKYVILDNLYK